MIGFAKKIGMTRLFIEGRSVPVTALQIDDGVVVQIKTKDKDGYQAVQVGAFPRKRKTNKAKLGHAKKNAGVDYDFYCLAEFKNVEIEEGKKKFDINDLAKDDQVDLTAKTIGRGFTGAVKRWGFGGQPKSHGHDHVRAVGSIGDMGIQRVSAGTKMAGHHGNENKTIKAAKIIDIDEENNLVFVSGSVPGANGAFVKFRKIN